jgi:hypothetical protein
MDPDLVPVKVVFSIFFINISNYFLRNFKHSFDQLNFTDLKVHKNGVDFECCFISLVVMHKHYNFLGKIF